MHYCKEVIDLRDVVIEKILVSEEFVSFKNKETDTKCFIRKKTDSNLPLFINFTQMTEFINKFEKSQYMFFVIENEKAMKSISQFGRLLATL